MRDNCNPQDEFVTVDLTDEEWCEYDFYGRVYRINNPVALSVKFKGSMHYVIDDCGVTHCLPAPGYNACIVRFKNRDGGMAGFSIIDDDSSCGDCDDDIDDYYDDCDCDCDC